MLEIDNQRLNQEIDQLKRSQCPTPEQVEVSSRERDVDREIMNKSSQRSNVIISNSILFLASRDTFPSSHQRRSSCRKRKPSKTRSTFTNDERISRWITDAFDASINCDKHASLSFVGNRNPSIGKSTRSWTCATSKCHGDKSSKSYGRFFIQVAVRSKLLRVLFSRRNSKNFVHCAIRAINSRICFDWNCNVSEQRKRFWKYS